LVCERECEIGYLQGQLESSVGEVEEIRRKQAEKIKEIEALNRKVEQLLTNNEHLKTSDTLMAVQGMRQRVEKLTVRIASSLISI